MKSDPCQCGPLWHPLFCSLDEARFSEDLAFRQGLQLEGNWLEVAGFPETEWKKQTMLEVFGVWMFFSMMDYPISGIALLFDVCFFSFSKSQVNSKMPHKKGRARDVVPHREHRTSKKATGKSNSPLIEPTRAALVVVRFDLDSLPLPAELWLRTMSCLDVMEVCRCENSSKALWDTLNRENTIWQKLCILHFPSMYSSVCTNPLGCPILSNVSSLQLGLQDQPMESHESPCCEETEMLQPPSAAQTLAIDWKMLFARRWQKQRKWERGRCKTQTSTAVTKRCTSCGELCDESGEMDCAIHPGDFLPRQTSDWSRVELQQLQSYARAAWRSIGGCTAIQRSARVYRGGGYWAKGLGFKGWGSKGHWAEGLGARPGPGNLRLCIIGHVPCTWSCCGAEDLISEGCLLGQHRLRWWPWNFLNLWWKLIHRDQAPWEEAFDVDCLPILVCT